MNRVLLCAGMSLAAAAAHARTPAVINGGGAASQQFVYAAPDVNGKAVSEQLLFDSEDKAANFGTYWSTISGAAQRGMLYDDLTCISNAAQSINGGNCSGIVGGASTVHYGISESTLSSAQIAYWSTSTTGQAQAGNLIQLPMLGTGLALVINETNVTGNGQVTLSDNDLCEIFSGGYSDFSQITDSATAPAPGPLMLVYRSDAAGTTFLLTNHLAAVCTAANTAPGVTFTPTTSFESLFVANPVAQQIPHPVPVSGLANLANTLAGLAIPPGGNALAQAISYISPDWTSVDSATSSAKLSNGKPSPLVVAGLKNGSASYIPDAPSIHLALTHVAVGQNLAVPSTAGQGANPTAWVPVIQTVTEGYPIVGYSTIELPQCYANKTITAAMLSYLSKHYNGAAFRTIQGNNGLNPVANAAGGKLLEAIRKNILSNGNGWGTDLGDTAACGKVVGR